MCLICERIADIQSGENPHFVAELSTGYVVIGDHQLFRGYTLFLCKRHVNELHDLDPEYRKSFLWEMSEVSAAVFRAFNAEKMNCELLGNTDSHLHWHLFPRFSEDAAGKKPVWTVQKTLREASIPSAPELAQLKLSLMSEIKKIPGVRTGDE